MDKELTEITPSNLGDVEVNTAKHASAEEAKAAAAAEKEAKQNYYIDPLEQDAAMEKRRQELEEQKRKDTSNDTDDAIAIKEEAPIEESIRPDMNVNGFFSAGQTATKQGIMNRSASKGTVTFCMLFGIINAIYSAFYIILLVSSAFDTNWFTGWIYAIVFVLTLIVLINSLRSMKSQKDDIKRKAMIGIFGSIISIVPLFAWIIHWILTTF